MKTYTAADIHRLIEQVAAGHDKLALDHRNTTDKTKAETLRRWAAVCVPLEPLHIRKTVVRVLCIEAPKDSQIFVGREGKLLAMLPELVFVFLTEVEMSGVGIMPVQENIHNSAGWRFQSTETPEPL